MIRLLIASTFLLLADAAFAQSQTQLAELCSGDAHTETGRLDRSGAALYSPASPNTSAAHPVTKARRR